MIQVLFVCLGNICRSPLAQGIFEHKLRLKNLDRHFNADSAGTSGWHKGQKPDSNSIRIAERYGIDISKQRSRPVHKKDSEIFDYLIAMDKSNFSNLIHEFGVPAEKVFLMRNFDPQSKNQDVPDPYSMGLNAFDEVYHILDAAIDGLIDHLIEKNNL